MKTVISSLVRAVDSETPAFGGEKDRALSTRFSIARTRRGSSPRTRIRPFGLSNITAGASGARRSSRAATTLSSIAATSMFSNRVRESSPSRRESSAMSVTDRSRRRTSSDKIARSCAVTAGSEVLPRLSTAEAIDASGFLSSWVTSAAKASVASIRSRRAWVMSDTARANMPISSLRSGRRGTMTSRERPSRTRTAACASRRRGVTIVRARNSDRAIERNSVPSTMIASRNRSARTRRVTSRALPTLRTNRVRSRLTAAAAVTIKVRSGASHTRDATVDPVITLCNSGQSLARSPASTKGSGTFAPTICSASRSTKRAPSLSQGSSARPSNP